MVEIEGEGQQKGLPGDGPELIAFMSFAVVRGFGAQHPLIALADRLHDTHRVPLGPLTTFYEALIEDAEDAGKLDLAWQAAAPLRDSVTAMSTALAEDHQCQALVRRASSEALPGQVAALIPILERAAAQGSRVRLSFAL